ncbi:hypothetical protein Q2465_24710, partial [Escherichia coli]|nr:hypothetical protein [Escherichia coli]
AAVVLGGTSLAGGKRRIVWAVIGAFIFWFLYNGLNFFGVFSYFQMIVKTGGIFLAGVGEKKKKEKRLQGNFEIKKK